jgi:hypothetical protein
MSLEKFEVKSTTTFWLSFKVHLVFFDEYPLQGLRGKGGVGGPGCWVGGGGVQTMKLYTLNNDIICTVL